MKSRLPALPASTAAARRGILRGVESFAADTLACLRFYSRLPVPVFRFEREPFAMLRLADASRALGVAGALIGALGALTLALGLLLKLPPDIASAFALTVLVASTGAFHEDGLADVADGFGGGDSRERKLAIMKDSRIGAFGATALILSFLLRWTTIAWLARTSEPGACLALVGAGAVSRVAGLTPLLLLEPARTDGAAASAGKPSARAFLLAAVTAIAFGLAPAWTRVGPVRPLIGLALAALSAWGVARLSRRQIGGYTGDVAGAAQQAAEIVFLSALCLGLSV